MMFTSPSATACTVKWYVPSAADWGTATVMSYGTVCGATSGPRAGGVKVNHELAPSTSGLVTLKVTWSTFAAAARMSETIWFERFVALSRVSLRKL